MTRSVRTELFRGHACSQCEVARLGDNIMASERIAKRAKARAGAPSGPKRLEEKDEREEYTQLFPGLPNEVSVDLIAAKFLSWKDICIMSSVSRGWCQAVRSRQVYSARVRAQSTEALTWHGINACTTIGVKQMFIRSMRDCNSCYQLPAISGLGSDLPLGSRLVPLDGRIFMLGGRRKSGDLFYSDEVDVLDLAGHKQWKPCAKMKQARGEFGCTVLDGRIYVFGGRQLRKTREFSNVEPVCGSEMYDPKENIWRSIRASPNLRALHYAFPIGSELVMKGGLVFRYAQGRICDVRAGFLEAYHPGKDQWRVPSNSENWVRKLSSLEDLHRIGKVGTDGTTIISRSPHLWSPHLSV